MLLYRTVTQVEHPSYPNPIFDDLPPTGARPLTEEETGAIPTAVGKHTWVVTRLGRPYIALATDRTPRGTWQLRSGCPFCGVRHTHGASEGHRNSHCGVGAHPWSDNGYYLLPPTGQAMG